MQQPPLPFSVSERELAAQLVQTSGGNPADPSYDIIARILKEDRPVTPEADLLALVAAFGGESSMRHGEVTVRVTRNHSGGAGFAFDRESMKITSLPKDGRYPAMQIGDVIIAVNDEPIANSAEYNRLARGNPDFRLGLRRTSASIPPPPSAPLPKAKAKASAARARQRAHVNGTDGWEAMAMDIDGMSYEELLALEERLGPVVQPGLQNVALDRLPLEYVCGGGGECTICLEDFCDGEELVRLPCMHKFHSGCCREWLRRQAKCPFCNFEVQM